MSWIETSLTRLEWQLRELIEGDPPIEGISRNLHKKLEKQLISAMKKGIQKAAQEGLVEVKPVAPEEYTLVLPAQIAGQLLTHPRELDRLSRKLQIGADRAGFRTARPPIIRVVAEPDGEQVSVFPSYSQDELGKSRTAVIEGYSGRANRNFIEDLPKAFIIINGLKTYALTDMVVNIGRDAENQIQIDDARVSRMHAQIRYIQGRFVIFDLDSAGGMTANSAIVASHILNPGDVIMLGGVPLVYGQEQSIQNGYTQEIPMNPPHPGGL